MPDNALRLALNTFFCSAAAGVGGGTSFSPAALNASLWNKGPFPGDPWLGSASAGASGARQVTSGGTVVAGAPQNGIVPGTFDGATSVETDSTGGLHWSDYVTASAGTLVALVKLASVPAAGVGPPDNPALFTDNGGNHGLNVSAAGLQGFLTDGVGLKSVICATPLPAATYAMLLMQWDGLNLSVSINGHALTSVACGNATVLGVVTLVLGANWNSSVHIDGDVEEFAIYPTALTAPQIAGLKAYYQTTYAVALA